MRMKTHSVVLIVLMMLGAGRALGADDVAGEWVVTITTAEGRINGKATLEQTAEKVTGHIGPAEDATIAIDGVLKGRKLTLTTHPRPGRTAAVDSCDLTIEDGKMVGTIHGGDAKKGTIEFVRARPNR